MKNYMRFAVIMLCSAAVLYIVQLFTPFRVSLVLKSIGTVAVIGAVAVVGIRVFFQLNDKADYRNRIEQLKKEEENNNLKEH